MADSAGGREVGRISIRVSPNLKGFYRDLKAGLEKIESSLKAKIPVEPDMGNFRSEVAAKTKGMTAKVKVDADVDRNFMGRITDTLSRIKFPEIPDPQFRGINAAGGGLAALVGVLAVAGPLVGLLTTALATIPGLIAAAAVPIGALALGMDGIKAAASRLAPAFEDLKKTMSSAAESQFAPVFDQLGKILPALKTALPPVTQGIADMAKSFTDTITSGAGMAKINSLIGNIAKALSTAAPGIAGFTNGLLGLAEGFSQKLPGIAEWFNKVGESFSNWVSKITADGTLSTAFDGLGATLKVIGETLTSLAGQGLEFMKDPERISKFNTALQGLGTALKSIMNDSIAFFNVMQDIKNVFTGFDFSGIWNDLKAPFVSQDAPWRDMWAGIQENAAAVWSTVTSTVQSAISTIGSIVSGIGATISNIWSGITAAASAAWNGVVAAVQSAWQGIVAAVSSGVAQAVAFVASMGGKITAAVGNFGSLLISAGKSLIQGLINGVKSMVGAAVAAVRDVASSVVNAAKGLLGIHSPSTVFAEIGVNTAQGFANGLQDGQARVIKSAADMVNGVNKEFDQFGSPGDYFSKAVDIATGFAQANLDQAKSDLGIGGGSITAALDAGLGWGAEALSKLAGMAGGPNFTFNVSNVDDAIAVKNNQLNKAALQYNRK